jgi:hypothetical protein
MGWEKRRIAIITVCVTIVSLYNASAEIDFSDDENLISSFEDQSIDSQDMSFFQSTHGYDASPKNDYIELKLNNTIYKLAPNGEMPVLCEIII